jgi:hypothetical protein
MTAHLVKSETIENLDIVLLDYLLYFVNDYAMVNIF